MEDTGKIVSEEGQEKSVLEKEAAEELARYKPNEERAKPLHPRHPQVVLQEKIERVRALWRRMEWDCTPHTPEAKEAFEELRKLMAPAKEPVKREEIPAVDANDPAEVRPAFVKLRLADRRKILIRFEQGTVDRMCYLPENCHCRFIVGDRIWVRPSNSPDTFPGFFLYGEYNMRGQRIR